jgi:RNA polymerase sigma-70 factor (ECF subfamily)
LHLKSQAPRGDMPAQPVFETMRSSSRCCPGGRMDVNPSFDRELSTHRSFLMRMARQRLRDAAGVEDVVQDTLLAALEGRHRFGERAALRTWLAGILLHKIADHVRRERRSPRADVADAPEITDDAAEDAGPEGPIEWRDPERMLENRQFIEMLQACLQRLSPLAARAFTLREIEGLDTNDASRALAVSQGQCAVLLHRARTRLRQQLEQQWFAA